MPTLRSSRLAGTAAVVTAAALLGPVLSAPGDLDTTFAGGAKVEELPGFSFAWDALILKDGRTLVAGESGAGQRDFTLLRYLPNGDPDPSFDGDGIVTRDFGGVDLAESMALLKDGRILLGGDAGTDGDFALARYLPSGAPDLSFGEGGAVVVDLGGSANLEGVFLGKKNRIVVGGHAGTPQRDFMMARFLSDGSPDLSFSGDGLATIDVDSGSEDLSNDAAVDKKGNVLVGGFMGGRDEIALVRFRKDGTPDPKFGQNGRVVIDLGGNAEVEKVLPLANGRIMLSGGIVVDDAFPGFVIRLLANGTPDPSFGDNGLVMLDQSKDVYAAEMIAGKKGIVYVTGSLVDDSDQGVFAIWALDKAGNLVPDFGENGLATTPVRDLARILGATASKTHLFAVGFSELGADRDITTARYLLK